MDSAKAILAKCAVAKKPKSGDGTHYIGPFTHAEWATVAATFGETWVRPIDLKNLLIEMGKGNGNVYDPTTYGLYNLETQVVYDKSHDPELEEAPEEELEEVSS